MFTKLVAREGKDVESACLFKQFLQAHQGLVVVVCVTTLAGHIHHQWNLNTNKKQQHYLSVRIIKKGFTMNIGVYFVLSD